MEKALPKTSLKKFSMCACCYSLRTWIFAGPSQRNSAGLSHLHGGDSWPSCTGSSWREDGPSLAWLPCIAAGTVSHQACHLQIGMGRFWYLVPHRAQQNHCSLTTYLVAQANPMVLSLSTFCSNFISRSFPCEVFMPTLPLALHRTRKAASIGFF